MLKLLEQPKDLSTFIRVLKMIYEKDAAPPQNGEEEKGAEEEDVIIEIEFNQESQTKIFKIVNDFLA